MKKALRATAALSVALLAIGGLSSAGSAAVREGTRNCAAGYRPSLTTVASVVGGTPQQMHSWRGTGGNIAGSWVTTSRLSSSYYVGYRQATWTAQSSTAFISVTPGCVLDPS